MFCLRTPCGIALKHKIKTLPKRTSYINQKGHFSWSFNSYPVLQVNYLKMAKTLCSATKLLFVTQMDQSICQSVITWIDGVVYWLTYCPGNTVPPWRKGNILSVEQRLNVNPVHIVDNYWCQNIKGEIKSSKKK